MNDFMTYEKVIELLKEIKDENNLTDEQNRAIDKAIKLMSLSDNFCLI